MIFFIHGKYRILFQVEGKNYIITNITLLITLLTNGIKILLLSYGANVVLVILSTCAVSLIQVVFFIIYIRRKYKWIDLKVTPNTSSLKQRNSAILHQISALIFQNTDVLILTVFCGLKVVSVYSMYKLIINHLDSLINIPFNSVNFILGQTFNTDRKKFCELIDTVEVFFSAFVFAIYSVFFSLIAPFLRLYTSGVSDIVYIDKHLEILFVAVQLLTFARIPMLYTINYAGHFKKTLPQTVIETVINLTVSLIAVCFLGIYGVLLGTLCALFYRTIDIIIYSNRKILQRSAFKTFSIYIVNTLLLLLTQKVYLLINIAITSYLYFIIVGVVLSIVFVSIHLGTMAIIYKKERNHVIKLIKAKIKHS